MGVKRWWEKTFGAREKKVRGLDAIIKVFLLLLSGKKNVKVLRDERKSFSSLQVNHFPPSTSLCQDRDRITYGTCCQEQMRIGSSNGLFPTNCHMLSVINPLALGRSRCDATNRFASSLILL